MNPKATKNLKSWKKGQSGNPAGKPKGVRNRTTIVRELLESKAPDGSGLVVDQVLQALLRKAVKGDVSAARELLDSAYGKVTAESEPAVTYNMLPTVMINGKPLVVNVGKPIPNRGDRS